MGEFDIDDSIDTSFSDDNSLDSFESSGDAFDAMDTVEVPPFEAPSLDNIESGGIEDHSFDDTEILSNGVDVTSDNSDTDLYIEQNASIEEIQDNESFYGIWCGASKEYSEAEEIANKLIAYGFEADILVTTDWENLNSEKWYAVSAGKYSSEEDAENILSDVQKIYSSAYIKFSGEHY